MIHTLTQNVFRDNLIWSSAPLKVNTVYCTTMPNSPPSGRTSSPPSTVSIWLLRELPGTEMAHDDHVSYVTLHKTLWITCFNLTYSQSAFIRAGYRTRQWSLAWFTSSLISRLWGPEDSNAVNKVLTVKSESDKTTTNFWGRWALETQAYIHLMLRKPLSSLEIFMCWLSTTVFSPFQPYGTGLHTPAWQMIGGCWCCMVARLALHRTWLSEWGERERGGTSGCECSQWTAMIR